MTRPDAFRIAVLLALAACVGGCAHHAQPPTTPDEPSRPWTPPESPSALIPAPEPTPATADLSIEPGRVYALPELIDLAMRTNPETRLSWERARAAAARLGRADADYLPILAVDVQAGHSRTESRTGEGGVFTSGPSITPQVELAWVLVDFGRRDADWDARAQELLAADFEFNRRHQEVAFAVQRAYFRFDAARAEIAATQATLDAARSVREAAEALLAQGLATRTDAAVARQQEAQARYELEVARKLQADARAELAKALGVSPATPIAVAGMPDDATPPAMLDAPVDGLIAAALAGRPDLAALAASVRARQAEIERADADFQPTLAAAGSVGGTAGTFRAEGGTRSFDYAEPIWGAFLAFDWNFYDGGRRKSAVAEARARAAESEAELALARLEAEGDVWRSWADYQAARTQVEFARVLLEASQEAYDAMRAGYRSGLNSATDLVQVERDLARARSTRIESRARMLTSAASLVFAVGAATPTPGPSASAAPASSPPPSAR
jgi:outer membrane protein